MRRGAGLLSLAYGDEGQRGTAKGMQRADYREFESFLIAYIKNLNLYTYMFCVCVFVSVLMKE